MTDADAGAATSANHTGSAIEGLSEDVEVYYTAPGYAINFALVSAIFALHVYWFVRVRRIARAELDHVSCVPKEGLEQKGYRSHWTGTCIKVLSILYALWMQAPILKSQRGSALIW